MHDNRTHPLLAQVPLTVSPFVTLPVAATLPYTYKNMPSTLPPSSSGITGADLSSKPQYVVSSSGGHAAHPDDIIASCRALQSHVAAMQADAERELRQLDERIKARELAEKRRVAPGWLDSEARLLEPDRKATSPTSSGVMEMGTGAAMIQERGTRQEDVIGQQFGEMSITDDRRGPTERAVDPGEEIDRAFGRLG